MMTKARKIASTYSLIIQPHPELGFTGNSMELSSIFTHARTEAQCMKMTREAIAVAVAVMLEEGQAPPAAASEERRDQQLNIRLTAEEKLILENTAKRRGFRGISDFVRTAALSETRKAG